MSCLHLEGLMGELQVLVVIDGCHLLMGSEFRCHHHHHHYHHHHLHHHNQYYQHLGFPLADEVVVVDVIGEIALLL